MKFVIVLFALAAVCLAAPQGEAEILSNTYEQGEQNYKFAWVLHNRNKSENFKEKIKCQWPDLKEQKWQ